MKFNLKNRPPCTVTQVKEMKEWLFGFEIELRERIRLLEKEFGKNIADKSIRYLVYKEILGE